MIDKLGLSHICDSLPPSDLEKGQCFYLSYGALKFCLNMQTKVTCQKNLYIGKIKDNVRNASFRMKRPSQQDKCAIYEMGHDVGKPVFGGLRTTKAQTSLHICTV